jgi:phospholipid/cholesterol/gamma-HCH transport system substrate-binding protein
MAQDLREGFHNLKLSTARSEQAIGRLNRIIEEWRLEQSTLSLLTDDPEFTQQIRRVAANLDTSGAEIRELTGRLNDLVSALQQGEGTLGMMLKDTVVAAEIRHGLMHLDSGLVKFDENMEALKHNWLTRGYFRKLEKQQKKESKKQQ